MLTQHPRPVLRPPSRWNTRTRYMTSQLNTAHSRQDVDSSGHRPQSSGRRLFWTPSTVI